MSSNSPLRRWAVLLRSLTIVAIVILCVVQSIGIFLADLPVALREAAGLAPEVTLLPGHRVRVALLGALPTLALLYVLGQMVGLFQRYAGGETLTDDCARHILHIGGGLLVAVALEMVCHPLQIMAASFANPPGERVLAITVEGGDLGQVLAGGLMIVIGWTVREAARVAEENRSFV